MELSKSYAYREAYSEVYFILLHMEYSDVKKIPKKIVDVIRKIKVLDRCEEYGVNRDIIEKSFMTLMPREERYTIVDRFYNNNDYKIEKLKLFYQKMCIKDEKI